MAREWRQRPLESIYAVVFLDAIHATFPQTEIQNCIIHQLRKVTKAKSVFPTDDSLLKMLHLAMMDMTQKWTGGGMTGA